MKQFVIDYMNHIAPDLSKEGAESLLGMVQFKKYKKGEIIIDQNIHPENFCLIKEGIVRCFVYGENEAKHTKGFYTDGELFSPLTSFISAQENKEIYDCLENVEVAEVNWHDFKEITVQDINIAKAYINFLEGILLARERRINNLITIDATDRYKRLKKDFPNIENLVAQYHIASYLNITPTQLSRIRRKLYSK